MKELVKGHAFELESMDGENPQIVEFINKMKDEATDELITLKDGTTNEEVLRMMIRRMERLQEKMKCWENTAVIFKLKECLSILQSRTFERIQAGVEGSALKRQGKDG